MFPCNLMSEYLLIICNLAKWFTTIIVKCLVLLFFFFVFYVMTLFKGSLKRSLDLFIFRYLLKKQCYEMLHYLVNCVPVKHYQ